MSSSVDLTFKSIGPVGGRHVSVTCGGTGWVRGVGVDHRIEYTSARERRRRIGRRERGEFVEVQGETEDEVVRQEDKIRGSET